MRRILTRAAIMLVAATLPLFAQTPAELQKLQDEAVQRAKEAGLIP